MQPKQRRVKWNLSESRGEPLTAFGQHLVPIGRILRVSWPGGGIVWHRPVAVEIQQDGYAERIPIPNLTRRIIVLLVLTSVMFLTLVSFWRRGGSNSKGGFCDRRSE